MPRANKSVHSYYRRAKRLAGINSKLYLIVILLLIILSSTVGWFIGAEYAN